jgi:protein farnesyltransferase subunit beta
MRSSYRRVVFRQRNGQQKVRKSKSTSYRTPPSMADVEDSPFVIPSFFTRPPPLRDTFATETSSAQENTIAECLPFLKGIEDSSRNAFDFNEHGVPRLDRVEHIDFLHQSLDEFPAAFVAVDASRPWMVYWALMGLYLLGEDVTPYRDRYVL